LPTIPTIDPSRLRRVQNPRPTGTGVSCGAEYRENLHIYSGNVWVSSCDYISRTRKPLTSKAYADAEFWIGQSRNEIAEPFVKLAQYTGRSLYRYVLLPEKYRFRVDDEVNNYTNIVFPILIPVN
jgi:hypothetical protein